MKNILRTTLALIVTAAALTSASNTAFALPENIEIDTFDKSGFDGVISTNQSDKTSFSQKIKDESPSQYEKLVITDAHLKLLDANNSESPSFTGDVPTDPGNSSSGNQSNSGGGQNNSSQTGRIPKISLDGVDRMYSGMATAHVTFDKNGANYTSSEQPEIYIVYTNNETGESSTTKRVSPPVTSNSLGFSLYNLMPGTEYTLMGVMNYKGRSYKTDTETFITPGVAQKASSSVSGESTSQNQTNGSTNSTSGNTTTVKSTTKNTSILGNLFGSGSKSVNSLQDKVFTGGRTQKNGLTLAITNEQARVDKGDFFTYTVRFQNGRTTALQNAEIVIELPEAYEFVRSSKDLDYNTSTNTVSAVIGRVAANTTQSFTFTVRAIGEGSGEIKTAATWFYEGGSIVATDRDNFHGGSKSVLGASVFGAGFFPQTLLGWMLIVILIAVIIIAARRYTTAPVVQAQSDLEKQKTA